MDILQKLADIWGIVAWIIGIVFALGMMYKTQLSHQSAIAKLFVKLETIEREYGGQNQINMSFRDELKRIFDSIGSFGKRLDGIYELLANKKND